MRWRTGIASVVISTSALIDMHASDNAKYCLKLVTLTHNQNITSAGCCDSCCCYVLMDSSANCRSQIASSHVAPLHGSRNSKRCIRRRRHRRNPAPLASGNEILFVGVRSVEPGPRLPGATGSRGGEEGDGCVRGRQTAPGCGRATQRPDQTDVPMTY